MKILCHTQKHDGVPTAEWLQCRTGRITASRIADVLNFLKPTKAMLAAGLVDEGQKRKDYRYEILCERLTSIPAEHYLSKPMQFGAAYEDDARRAYELKTETMVDQEGFVLHPSFDFAGSSPDGLVGDQGGLEIKVPRSETHIEYLDADVVPEEYKPQMYFNMICCEREWWDFASFDPRQVAEIQLFTKRLVWDDAEAERINGAVMQFNETIDDKIAYLQKRFGPFKLPAAQAAKVQQQDDGLGISDEDIAWAQGGFQ